MPTLAQLLLACGDEVEADFQQTYQLELRAVWGQRTTRWLLVRLRGLLTEDTRTRRWLAAWQEAQTGAAEDDEDDDDE